MAQVNFELLDESSRTWIYRSNRKLNSDEVSHIEKNLNHFINQWTAHSHSLNAHGKVYHDQFIAIFLDEQSSSQASGCSIDSQVNYIKQIGESINVDFFDRNHFDFLINNDEIITVHKDTVRNKISEGVLTEDSLVFNHLVKTKNEFSDSWTVPLSQSWHKRLI